MTTVRAHPRKGTRGVRRHYRMAFLRGEEDANQLRYRSASQLLTMMTPDEYLDLINFPQDKRANGPRGWTDSYYYDELTKKIAEGVPVDAPWLEVDYQTGRVGRQEGRHRALAAKQLGIEKIPVLLYHVDERGRSVNIRPDPYQHVPEGVVGVPSYRPLYRKLVPR